jgi:hypothetical protein
MQNFSTWRHENSVEVLEEYNNYVNQFKVEPPLEAFASALFEEIVRSQKIENKLQKICKIELFFLVFAPICFYLL